MNAITKMFSGIVNLMKNLSDKYANGIHVQRAAPLDDGMEILIMLLIGIGMAKT